MTRETPGVVVAQNAHTHTHHNPHTHTHTHTHTLHTHTHTHTHTQAHLKHISQHNTHTQAQSIMPGTRVISVLNGRGLLHSQIFPAAAVDQFLEEF